MKELSIEEKAKRYDEAKLRMSAAYNSNRCTIGFMNEIFPELQENEDEIIRKKLIALIEWSKSYAESGITTDEAKEMIALVEKQGEQKPYGQRQECVDCQFNYAGECKGSCAMKRGEQKPTDTVEPKFKVGDWIVATGKCVYLIAKIDDFNVTLIDTNGYEYMFDASSLDDAYQWTIQDAKDGDVLYSRCCKLLWIYKDEKTCYVGYNLNYNSGSIVINKCVCIPTDVQPTTKEQRDTLEKAMTDAGYTFDFEKKELKKIEQNPAENKGMNLVEEEMTPFQKKVFCIIDTSIEEEQGLKQVCDELLRLAHNEIMIKQKPSWSEENEKMLRTIISDGIRGAELDKAQIDWLKFLKDRVQPKQEWSEEDRITRNALIKLVENLYDSDKYKSDKNRLLDFLKSLRPQSTWKPSDEQIIELRRVISGCSYDIEPLAEMEEQLKKLREE